MSYRTKQRIIYISQAAKFCIFLNNNFLKYVRPLSYLFGNDLYHIRLGMIFIITSKIALPAHQITPISLGKYQLKKTVSMAIIMFRFRIRLLFYLKDHYSNFGAHLVQ